MFCPTNIFLVAGYFEELLPVSMVSLFMSINIDGNAYIYVCVRVSDIYGIHNISYIHITFVRCMYM